MRIFKFLLPLLFCISLMGFAETFSGSSTSALNAEWSPASIQNLQVLFLGGAWDNEEKWVNIYELALGGDVTVRIIGAHLTPVITLMWDGDSYDGVIQMYSFDIEDMPVTDYGTLALTFDGTENETEVTQYLIGKTWSDGGSFGASKTWTLTISNSYTARGSVKVDGETYTAPIEDITDGETKTLQAYPAAGYDFDSWSGDLVSEDNPDTISMDDDKTVAVNWDSKTPTITSISPAFARRYQTLIVTITGRDFQSGAGVSFGGGVTVNSTWGSGTTLYASISTGSSSGPRDVVVTNYNTTKTATKKKGLFIISASTLNSSPKKPSLSAVGVSPSDIRLTITPDPTNKVRVKGYKFYWENPDGEPWTVLKENTNSETISYSAKALYGDDLTSSTTYEFVVYAVSIYGYLSPPSDSETAITQPPYPPPAPTGLTEVSTGETAIYISWTAPDYSPGEEQPAVTDYLMSATDMSVIDGTTYQNYVGSNATSGTITGLSKTTQYMVTVAAVNSAGIGAISDYILSTTTGDSRYTVTINELNDVEGAIFTIFTDSARTEISVALCTDSSGQDTVDLVDGTYYYTASKEGYLDRWGSFAVNGEALQVDFALNGSGKDSFFIFLQ